MPPDRVAVSIPTLLMAFAHLVTFLGSGPGRGVLSHLWVASEDDGVENPHPHSVGGLILMKKIYSYILNINV